MPSRQERPPRSLDEAEFLEVYRVAVTTGRDPELDGLLLRHQLIHAVRRSGLLALTAGGLDVPGVCCTCWDQKRKTHRTRPSTPEYLSTLLAHVLDRGPRIAAAPDAPHAHRLTGIQFVQEGDPVF